MRGRVTTWRHLAALSLASLGAGCAPSIGDGQFLCDPDGPRGCPQGFACVAQGGAGVCRSSSPPSEDAGTPADCDERCRPPACGCDDGLACYPHDSLGRGCYLAGARREGEACAGFTDCAPGFGCVHGICRGLCEGDADCPEGTACALAEPGADLFACSDRCTPSTGRGCLAGRVCALEGAGEEAHTACRFEADATGPAGGDCCRDVCAHGFTCLAGADAEECDFGARCRPYCNLSDPSNCASSETCVALPSAPFVDGVEWGACVQESP
jgi:hypothetical protein